MTDSLLMQRLAEMETLGVASEIYFSAGLPGETGQDHDQLKNFCLDLRSRFSCIQATRVHSIELDPASPMYMEPEKHGLTDTLRTFEDYRRYHSAGESMLGGLGYGMAGGQEDWQKAANYTARVEELICDKFCRAALPSTWKLPGALRPAAEAAIRRACGAASSMHRSRLMRPKWADPFPY